MKFDIQTGTLFVVATIFLLGSPGPGVAALIGVGCKSGFFKGQRFFWGLQLGLAVAARLSACCLFSLVATISFARFALSAVVVC